MFVDHFDNGSVDLLTHPSVGTIDEPAGSQLRMTIPDGQGAVITEEATGAMVAYKAAGVVATKGIDGPYSFDVKLDKFTNTNSVLCLAGVMAWNGAIEDLWDTKRCYYVAYYANESQVICDGFVNSWSSPGRLHSSGARTKPDDGSNKHIYRIFVNPLDKRLTLTGFAAPGADYINPNSVGFAFSTDQGAVWTWAYQRTLDFEIDWVGPMIRNWTPAAGQTHEALFDYFALTTYEWDSKTRVYVPGPHVSQTDEPEWTDRRTMFAMRDEVDLTRGGGGQTDLVLGEDRGAFLPGPIEGRGESGRQSPAHFGMEDELEVIIWPGDDRFAVLPGSTQDEDNSNLPAAMGAEDDLGLMDQGPGLTDWFSLPELKEPFLLPERAPRQGMGAEDQVYWELDEADYQEDKLDSDGKELLYATATELAKLIKTDEEGFGDPTANNHWGAARDGKFYANGVECGTEGFDFGTVAGGFKDSAWNFPTRPMNREPYYNTTPSWFTITMTADDEVEIFLDSPPSDWITTITSWGRWVIDGDFDIQVDFEVLTWTQEQNRFEFGVGTSLSGNPGATQVYIYTRNNSTYAYTANRHVNGSYASLGSTAMTPETTGKLRITRTAGVYQCYKWNGSSWDTVGTTFSDPTLEGPVYVWMGPWSDDGDDTKVRMSNFTINSGTVINTVGWYREASGDHRGVRQDMPEELAVVGTLGSLELIETANNKLWMRFIQAANYILFDTTNGRKVRDVLWKDGILLVAMSGPTTYHEGGLFLIDFTTDVVRVFQESASTICGAFFKHWLMHEPGDIAHRNVAYGYSNDNDTWRIPDYRIWSTAIFIDSGYVYIVVGSQEGLAVFRWKRWEFTGTEGGVNDDDWGMVRSNSTEVSRFLCCDFDADGDLFYLTEDDLGVGGGGDAVLYSRDRTNGTPDGWEDGIPGGTFTAEYSKILPGTRSFEYQYRFHLYKPATTQYVFVPANEGVYRIDWPSGSWELFYGQSGSGATHEILPPYVRVTSIDLTDDGTVDVMVVGIEGGAESQIVAVRLSNNTLYGISVPKAPTRAPKSLGA